MSYEVVKVELESDAKVRLKSMIDERMEQHAIEAGDFAALELGCKLPEGWPADKDCKPTLAELVVVAKKLSLQIVIKNIELRKV